MIVVMQASLSSYATERARWNAVERRSPRADGIFFYAVASTGVYCRPSCAARRARRENVRFYETREAAERAGFRPCLRCRPDLPPRAERDAALIAEACRFLDRAAEADATIPSLAKLAERAELTPSYFHRLFRRIAGITPKAYASAHRARKLAQDLPKSVSVTDAIYAAGFPSSSRFYETAQTALGMKPAVFRQGGEGEFIEYAVRKCSLGRVLVAATARGVCAIFLGDDPASLAADLRARFPRANLTEPGARAGDFSRWVEQAVRLVDDPVRSAARSLPLDIRGTAFQCRVWKALQSIRPGATSSYAEVAAAIGKPGAARAVAGACAANRLAVVIPCHRVVPATKDADGKTGGYRWGADRKKRLLERERPASSR